MVITLTEKINNENLIMTEGDGVKIPCIQIEESSFEDIIQSLNSINDKAISESIFFSFELERKNSDIVDLTFVFSPEEEHMMSLLSRFGFMAQALQKNLNLEFIFFNSKCQQCPEEIVEQECLKKGSSHCRLTGIFLNSNSLQGEAKGVKLWNYRSNICAFYTVLKRLMISFHFLIFIS